VIDIGVFLCIPDIRDGETQTTNGGPGKGRHCARLFCRVLPVKHRKRMRTGSILTRHQVDRRVLASSIDLDIELKPVTLVEIRHTGPLNRADVHEGIGLPIVARDEAKALHRIEELDRAGRLLARELPLLRSFTLFDGDDIADDHEIGRRDLPAAIDESELKLLAFGKPFKARAFHGADVDEHVLAAVFPLDEAEALAAVEELYDTAALADDLCRHAATGTAAKAATTTTAAAEAAAWGTAAEAAATTAAAETATAAAATAKTIATAAKAITAAAREGIEIVFTETVPLVPATAAPSSVKTHKT
jgi:hypothetical protein